VTGEPSSASEPAVLVLDGVHKRFGDHHVLRGIDLLVRRGEVTVLIGPSGSGKSTLLRCINHLERVDGGRILVNGRLVGYRETAGRLVEARDAELARHRREIGMVFQQFNLFPHLTALGNVTAGPIHVLAEARPAAEARGRQLLELVGLAHKADAYPGQLSGGQQQRVAIARALAMEPELMLFDEPTSALDPEMITEVLDVMLDLSRRGTTMLVVTHEMGFARAAADRIIFMDEGRLVEEAPPARFFAEPRHERTRQFLGRILH
jgi:polar amino acid transport system ATP-binding protein